MNRVNRGDAYPVLVFVVLALLSYMPRVGMSQGDKQQDKQALAQTQEMLKDSVQRASAIQNTPGAEKLNSNLKAFAGSDQNVDHIYNISADVMEMIAKEANNDPKKMQEILQAYQSDPESLLKKLDPKIQRDISSVAKDIEQEKKSRP